MRPPLYSRNFFYTSVRLEQSNSATIVVVRCPGACELPWLSTVRAVLFEGIAGQESGNSIALTIIGASNPSGALPLSFPHDENDTWLSA